MADTNKKLFFFLFFSLTVPFLTKLQNRQNQAPLQNFLKSHMAMNQQNLKKCFSVSLVKPYHDLNLLWNLNNFVETEIGSNYAYRHP